jgi:hypothetical protein
VLCQVLQIPWPARLDAAYLSGAIRATSTRWQASDTIAESQQEAPDSGQTEFWLACSAILAPLEGLGGRREPHEGVGLPGVAATGASTILSAPNAISP